MYFDALSFLEDERDAFRPYERLLELSDDQLSVVVPAANGWRGRDLMGHMLLWQEAALATAKELAMSEQSPTMARLEAEWDSAPDAGDRMNDAALAEFGALPLDELRERFRTVSGELRGYLTVVPESRWIKHATNQEWLYGETTEHYEDHLKELQAILQAVT